MIKMSKFALIFLSLVVMTSCKPKVDIYIESLCPDCMQFMTTSFNTFINKADYTDLADVNIYPFGNGKESKQADVYTFSCQHGPNECYGNNYYACANNVFQAKYGNLDQSFNFITCMEKNVLTHGRNFDFTAYHCLEEDQEVLSLIQQCVHVDSVWIPLMHQVAQKTNSLVPQHTHVPWVVVDDKWDLEVENKIISDMYGYLKSIQSNLR